MTTQQPAAPQAIASMTATLEAAGATVTLVSDDAADDAS